MEHLSACPACNNKQLKPYLVCKDYTVSGENFSLSQCGACSLVFTNPRPNSVDIWPYYKADSYVSHTDEAAPGIINQIYLRVRRFTLASKAKLVKRVSKGNRLLDIGAGTGAFAAQMQELGWTVVAVEPDESARAIAIKRGLVTGDESLLKTIAPVSVITMWHVLEHVHQLQNRVEELYRLLEPGGVAIIAVPNPNSTDAAVYGEHWAAYDVPRHLYHFTPKSIRQLFEKEGFISENTKWMPFDPFYIALLSEQYKHGKQRLLPGFIQGFRSWLVSAFVADRCSSQIYIFRKP